MDEDGETVGLRGEDDSVLHRPLRREALAGRGVNPLKFRRVQCECDLGVMENHLKMLIQASPLTVTPVTMIQLEAPLLKWHFSECQN